MQRIVSLVFVLVFPLAAQAATFVVNSTNDAADANPGNGICATAGGVCTLRAAIGEANALAGSDTITFSIGSGPQTITPAGIDLPPITGTTTIDATTQPGSGSGPRIFLDGANLRTVGFDDGAPLIVRGLAIGGFTTAGIRTLQTTVSVTIEKCYIGVGLDGVTAHGNGDGIQAKINDFGGSALIVGNTTGGGNVISGNLDMGIELTDNGGAGAKLTTFTVQGNIFGLGADGMTAVPNLSGAIRTNLQFGTITVGGSAAGRNIISGNGGGGYQTAGFFQADAIVFSYNYVGVAIDGITPRGNSGDGANLVAKVDTVEQNIIAANGGNGLNFSTSSLTSPIRGNRIGVGLDGSAHGNGGAGINWTGFNGGLIGGPATDQNIIANNAGAGVRITSGQAEVAENSIYGNGQLGIDIGTANVEDTNDALDADTGSGNNVQNHPVIASAVVSGGVTFINGSLGSAASSSYVIRFFSSTAADVSGFGEGETYIGTTTVTTNGAGNAGFTFTAPPVGIGTYITATATAASGDTSEFSNALIVAAPQQFRFAAAAGTSPESGSVTLTIERINGSIGTASVDWATAPGTAGTADYTTSSGTANFAAGQITRTITIPIKTDTLDEIDESFSVVLSNPTGGAELASPSTETVTITDDDPPPSVTIADAGTTEGNAGNKPLTFNVSLSAPSGKVITVDYVTGNGTATAGSDYAAAAGTVTFNPGEVAKTVTVQLIGDTVPELDETFTVTLSNPSNVTFSQSVATGTIVNDDGGLAITIGDVAAVEGDSGTTTAVFPLTLSGQSALPVTVNWSTSDGTATAGSDYQAASGTVTFPPGTTTASISVTINGDTVPENNETFFVDLSGPVNATLADAQGIGTIADDDGTPSLSINDPAVVEGAPATFTVTLAPASALPVTVAYATGNLTAFAGSDYTAASGTLTFAPGETSKTVAVTTLNDTVAEGTEQFQMTLSAPSGATIGDDTGTASILDDDGVPRVTIGNASAAEGNSGSTTLTFNVDLSTASASFIDVTYAFADGTATFGSDYGGISGILTFAPGETSKSISVTILGDTVVEPDETFFVELMGATNATIVKSEGTGTIVNDDGAAAVSIADVSASEGTGGTTTFTFNVSLSAASSQTVTVPWATADGTAVAGSDYTAGAGSVIFAPGETLKTVTVAVTPDALFEPNETFVVNLLGASNATITHSQGVGTIVNDDPAPAIPAVSIAPVSVTEGNAGSAALVFNVTLNVPTVNSVTVDYATGGGTATAGTDYVPTSGTLTFAPGVTAQTVTVTVLGDTVVEGNETFQMTLSSPSNATLGTSTATGTILDDDSAPAIPAISIAGASVTEGNSGSTALTFPVTLSVPTTIPVTVSYTTGGGTAAAGSDYVATSGTLTFAPGITAQSITVPVLGDTAVEGNETFLMTLSSPSNATLGTSTATGMILDDDSAPAIPAISIAGASVTEGNSGSTALTFPVTLSVPTTIPVTVSYATGGGTAAAGTDYVTTSGTLTFAPGITAQSITVPVLGDTAVEGNETLLVTLSSPSNATLGTSTATGTILDDDSLPVVPAITIGDVSQLEGDAGATLFAFPVTLNTAAAVPVSVAWTTVSGSAIAGSDFAAASGTVVFAPGMTTQTISVAVNGDTVVEPDETFTVQLSAPANATVARGTALGTMRNDDQPGLVPSPVPTLRADAVRVVEGNDGTTQAQVTLTLSSPAAGGAAVRWMTHAGTATGGSDFVEDSGRVTFGTNTTATIALSIIGDRVVEGDEMFNVELFEAVGAVLQTDRIPVTIVDDDSPVPPRAIVLAAGSLRGNAGARFGTAVQMVNPSDVASSGALVLRPAGTNDPATDVTIPYTLGPRELRAWGDLLADNGLSGLATLDVVPSAGPLPRLTVRIYDDGSGHGTTGFTLPVVTPDDALTAGHDGVLAAPENPVAMRFNVGIRTLDAGASMTIEVRDRSGNTRQTTTRDFLPNWFNQLSGADFAGIALGGGDYILIHLTRGSALLYGAAVDNLTNDPSVQVVGR